MKKILTTSAIALMLVLSPAVAIAKGGSGTIGTSGTSAGCIGDGSNAACFSYQPVDIRLFTGTPDLISYGNSQQIWSFYYLGNGKTEYAFQGSYDSGGNPAWQLDNFYTTLTRFHTSDGSRVGMSLGQVKRHEGRRLKGHGHTMHESVPDGNGTGLPTTAYFYFNSTHRLTGIELING